MSTKQKYKYEVAMQTYKELVSVIESEKVLGHFEEK